MKKHWKKIVIPFLIVGVMLLNPKQTNAATPPTLSATSGNTWTTTTGTTRTTGSVSWNIGDVLLVMGATEGDPVTLSTPTTAGSGVTFALVTNFPTATPGAAKVYAWSATASAASSGTITSNNNGASMSNIQVFVYSGSGGIGNSAVLATGVADTLSLTRGSDNSAVVWVASDFGATNDTTVAAVPVSGGTQRQAAFVTSAATMFLFDWTDQGTAGATSYGISGFVTADNFTKGVVEVKGSTASTTVNIARVEIKGQMFLNGGQLIIN